MKWLFLRSHHFVGGTYPICKSTGSSLSHHFMAQELGNHQFWRRTQISCVTIVVSVCFSAQNVAGQIPSFWCLNHLDRCFTVKSAMLTPCFMSFGGRSVVYPHLLVHTGPRRVKTPGHIQQAAKARVPVADQRNGGQSAQRAHLEAVMDLLGCVWIDYRAIQGKPYWNVIDVVSTWLVYVSMGNLIYLIWNHISQYISWCNHGSKRDLMGF